MDKREDNENREPKRHAQAGFTLVEMLLVIMIIGVLAAVAVVQLGDAGTTAKITATHTSIAGIVKACEIYEIVTGSKPKSLEDLTSPLAGYPKGLLDKKKLNDAWGTPFQLKFNGDDYEIRSAGKDRQMGTDDDLHN